MCRNKHGFDHSLQASFPHIWKNQQHLICIILPIQSAQKLCQFQTPSLHPSSFIGDRFLLTATAHAARTKTKRNEEKPSHLEPLAPDRQRQTLRRPPFFTPNFSEIPPLSQSISALLKAQTHANAKRPWENWPAERRVREWLMEGLTLLNVWKDDFGFLKRPESRSGNLMADQKVVKWTLRCTVIIGQWLCMLHRNYAQFDRNWSDLER